jgi:microcystin-dependent protein
VIIDYYRSQLSATSDQHLLNGAGAALLRSVISSISKYSWNYNGNVPTIEQYDEIEGALDGVMLALSTPYASEGSMIIGTIVPVALSSLPSNMLLCDGSQYEKLDFPDLYAVLDAAYIIDSDYFVVPNLSGRIPIGANETYEMGTEGGEAAHTLTIGEIPSHTHETTDKVLSNASGGLIYANPSTGTAVSKQTILTGASGLSGAHNNMPPYHAVKWAIVAL